MDGPGLGVGLPERIHADRSPARRAHQRQPVDLPLQANERQQARCEPRDARARQVLGNGAGERVAAGAVAAPGLAQVAVVLTALEQMRQGQLVDRGTAVVHQRTLGEDPIPEIGRQHHPADPEGRRECLAHGPHVGDLAGREPLHRRQRRAVVAELGVIVILDDQATCLRRPCEKPRPACGRKRDARRGLVRGGHQHRPDPVSAGARPLEVLDPRPLPVHLQRCEPGPLAGDDLPVLRKARVLDRNARAPEGPRDKSQRLGGARSDDDRLRIGHDPANAAKVPRERPPQLRCAAGVGVAEGAVRGAAHDGAQRAQPWPAGEP